MKAAWAAALLVAGGVGAQQPAGLSGTVEAGISGSQVTQDYGHWRSAYLRGAFKTGEQTVVFPEVVTVRQFHDEGTFLGLAATRTLNADWYAFGSVGTSAGGFYLPRLRASATLHRKLLSSRRLVVNSGVSYFKAKDTHRETALAAGAVYYFTSPWIVEGGTSWNTSQPGSARSQSFFGAITEGREGRHYVILRAGGGGEAYQIVAPGNAVTDFHSSVVTLTWRQWLGRVRGSVLAVEHYRNPYYRRTGLTLGGFWQIN